MSMTKYLIEVHGDDVVLVADALEALAGLVRIGAEDMVATICEGDVIMSMKTKDYTYEHGDRDNDGNLVHVHEDTVVHVTYAGIEAKQENDLDINVGDWMEEHGPLTEAS
jgi:hypothetical protein